MKYKFLIAILFVTISVFAGKYASVIFPQIDAARSVKIARAAGNAPVIGWMYMDDIGWISFSSTNDHDPNTPGVQQSTVTYGVFQDNLSLEWDGWAWSPSAGWVHFTSTSCPPGTTVDATNSCGAKVLSGRLVGFAEFVTWAPWWDPYISFSEGNDHDFVTSGVQSSTTSYHTVIATNGDISGNAWHSNGGWISYVGAKVVGGSTVPTIHLKPHLSSTTLTSGLSGTAVSASTVLTVPSSTSIVGLTWYKDPGAPAYATCSLTSSYSSNWSSMSIDPQAPADLQDVTVAVNTDANIQYTASPSSQTYTLGCKRVSDGVLEYAPDAVVQVTAGACTISASWNPAPVPGVHPSDPGYISPAVSWTSTNTTNCIDVNGVPVGTSGTTTLTNAAQGTVYSLTCDPLSGAGSSCSSGTFFVSYDPPPTGPQCSDLYDNDGDGFVDFVDNWDSYFGQPGQDGILDGRVDVIDNTTGLPSNTFNPVTGSLDGGDGIDDYQTYGSNISTPSTPTTGFNAYADPGCSSFVDKSESKTNQQIKEK